MMRLFLVLPLAFFLLMIPAARAETLTRQQAIDLALKHDPRIRERRHLVDAARALLQQVLGRRGFSYDVNAFVGLSPAIDGGFYRDGAATCTALPCTLRSDGGKLEDGVSLWTHIQFRIVRPLATFGKIHHYSAAAQGQVDIRRADVQLQKRRVRLQLLRAWYGYLTARETRYLFEDVHRRVVNAERLVRRWIRIGRGTVKQSDLYALQTARSLMEKYLAQATAVERIALDGLRVLTGKGLGSPLRVAERRIRPVPLPKYSLERLIRSALEKRPEMRQLVAGMRARRSLVRAHKAEKRPNIYVGLIGSGSWSPDRERLYNPYIVDPFNGGGLTPVIGIQWSWNGRVHSARVAQARAKLKALNERAAFARQGIPYQVAEQYHRVHGLYKALKSLARGSRFGRRWMLTRYTDFEAGLEKPAKIIEAFQGYILAYSDYLKTVNDYNLAVARLMSVAGMDEQ